MNYLSIIERTIEQQRERITAVSDKIWEFAEVRYEEAQSAELMAQGLKTMAFRSHERLAASIRRLSPPTAAANRSLLFSANMTPCPH